MDFEDERDFDWKCPKCGESGYGCRDKVFRFCPFCGSMVNVKEAEG